MGLKVAINRDRCIGTGNCVYWLPHVFDLDDDGYALVKDVTADSEASIVAAAQHCPTHAITVERNGERVV